MIVSSHGIHVDVTQLADGCWRMMGENLRLPMVLGMIPFDIADTLKKQVTDRIAGIYEERYGYRPDRDNPTGLLDNEGDEVVVLASPDFKEFIYDIMHHWSLEMYRLATEDGYMVV